MHKDTRYSQMPHKVTPGEFALGVPPPTFPPPSFSKILKSYENIKKAPKEQNF